MNHQTQAHDRELWDEFQASKEIRQGHGMAHDLPFILMRYNGPDDAGAKRWQSEVWTEQQTRDAVKKYAAWLTRVADEAR